MSASCRQLVDGKGALRAARVLMLPKVQVRRAKLDDARKMYEWRNDARIRNVSRDISAISYDDHLRWFEGSLVMPKRMMLIGELETSEPVGVVRFDEGDNNSVEVSIYLDPQRGGQGLGSPLLEAAENYLVSARNSAVDIVAYTMSGNAKSEYLFKRGGYNRTATCFLKKRSG